MDKVNGFTARQTAQEKINFEFQDQKVEAIKSALLEIQALENKIALMEKAENVSQLNAIRYSSVALTNLTRL